ncbi:MAG: FtsX-like permease family protein [Umezawaea sp.]
MSALGRVVRSGVGRRRVQTVVIGLATAMAVAAAVLGGSLLVASAAPFDTAFAEQHGAHLSVQVDGEKATAARVEASAKAAGVTAAAGPFRTVSVAARDQRGHDLPPLTVVGRADPGGAVDAVTLLQGTWVTGPDQIVLSSEGPVGDDPNSSPLGKQFTFPDLPGAPALTVVGLARSVSRTAGAWVSPAAVPKLTQPDSTPGFQVLYRFAAADTAEQVEAGRVAVTAGLSAEAVNSTRSWLALRQEAARETALLVPFIVAFGLLGLVMSVLIVGNVVAGAVSGGLRRIGVLKALGFTPGQVVRAHVAQALVPAAVGVVIGVVVGNVVALPVLAETREAYGAASAAVEPLVNVVVIVSALVVVAVTAWASAWRAGRLRTVDALAVGRAGGPARGRRAAALAARLPLPRSVTLGLARPFARPARAVAMLAAIVFGATAVTLAVGLAASLNEIQIGLDHDTADVTIGSPDLRLPPGFKGTVEGPGGRKVNVVPDTADRAAIDAAIGAQSGTLAHYSTAVRPVAVVGLSAPAPVSGFTGDVSFAGYRMISGRWFAAPGEVVVPTTFLTATGTRVGDTLTLDDRGRTVVVRVVGELFDTRDDGMGIFTDAATLADLKATSYSIAVRPGTDVAGYLTALNSALRPQSVSAEAATARGGGDLLVLIAGITATLTLVLVAVAGLGVLNGVVLDTRERVHDIGVHKALGMTPRQTTAMVLSSVVLTGLLGGALGVPLGMALHGEVMPAMARSAGLGMPTTVFAVYHPAELVLLGAGGLLIAVLGALLPAGWAARTRTATALRTE